MSPTWRSADPPPLAVIHPAGWLLVLVRGLALALMLAAGLALLALLRLAEKLILGGRRRWSSQVPRRVCRLALVLLGIRLRTIGRFDRRVGIMVANHASWLDILVLNTLAPMCFVSKSEVAGWPGIGLLARATGTLFIARDPRQARVQQAMIAARLASGDRLTLFPEGTSTDGTRVLPFKPTLFAAVAGANPAPLVQPVSIRYLPPKGLDRRYYGWWGAMDFGPHALTLLAQARRGEVRVVLSQVVDSGLHADRKTLALDCERAVRSGWETVSG